MTKEKEKKLFSIVLMVLGITCIVFAILYYVMPPLLYAGDIEYNLQYGGDAYTGIQNAAAQTACNIYYLNQNLEDVARIFTLFAAAIFLILGILFLSFGILKLLSTHQNVVDEIKIEEASPQI